MDEKEARAFLKYYGNFGGCEIRSIALDIDRGEARIFVHNINAAPCLANLQPRKGAIVFSGVVWSELLKVWKGETGRVVSIKVGKCGKDDYGLILEFAVLIAWREAPASYTIRCREITVVE